MILESKSAIHNIARKCRTVKQVKVYMKHTDRAHYINNTSTLYIKMSNAAQCGCCTREYKPALVRVELHYTFTRRLDI